MALASAWRRDRDVPLIFLEKIGIAIGSDIAQLAPALLLAKFATRDRIQHVPI
jgi:hypothetical protein